MDSITGNRLALLAGGLLVYYASLAIYRLYFSPLAKFPGPKLAALTLWFEFYYDVVKRGEYTWKIAEMHKQYGELPPRDARCSFRYQMLTKIIGPIVRISPHELHIDDPE